MRHGSLIGSTGVLEVRVDSLRAECVQLDPHPVVREAGLALLARIRVALVTATPSADEALYAISLHHPELFLVEPLMPEAAGFDGLECIRRSLIMDPDLTVVAFSAGGEAEWRTTVLDAGAAAFIPKSAPTTVVEETIIDVLERARSSDEALLSDLTPRELEILALVAEHRTNAEVAQILWLSRDTVKFHLANVYRKVAASNRSEAVRWARRHGLAVQAHEATPAPPARLWSPQPFARCRPRVPRRRAGQSRFDRTGPAERRSSGHRRDPWHRR